MAIIQGHKQSKTKINEIIMTIKINQYSIFWNRLEKLKLQSQSSLFLSRIVISYEKNLFEGTEKALLETVTRHVAFSGEGLFWRISNTSLELV